MVTPEERMISQYSTNKRSEYDFFDHDSVDVDKHIRLMRELKESKIKIGKKFYHWKFFLVISVIFLLSFFIVYYHTFLFDIRGTILSYFFIIFTVIATPFAVAEPIMLLRNRKVLKYVYRKPKPGRKLLIVITTNGKATEVVNKIIATLRSYNMEMDIWALIEEYDKTHYDCPTIVVPSSYTTPKHSLNKHRALNYLSEWMSRKGYGKETYVVHLDDDSIVTKEYLQHVLSMDEDAGVGTVRLREYRHFLFSTLADFGRVADYDSFITFFTSKHKPIGVNGEGLVIRADIESKLGWDYGPVAAEDLVMGQKIYTSGYSFGFIPGFVYIAPALNALDFYRQRRRWIDHFFKSFRDVWRMRKVAALWFSYTHSFGWGSIAGIVVWIISSIMGFHINEILVGILLYDLVISFVIRQYGASTVKDWKFNLKMIVFQIPTVIFESGTFFYYILRKPKTQIDYTIKKV